MFVPAIQLWTATKKLQIIEHNLTPAQMQQYLAIVNEVERYRDLSEEEKENLDFLPEEIDSVEPLPNEIDKARPDDKNIIMDVLCKTSDGRTFICEMQRKKKASFKNRMLYYGASMLHSQLKPKQTYSDLRPVYVVCFMDYRLKHDTDQLVYRYTLREQDFGELYNNLLSIYLCELTRLKENSLEGLDPVHSWFYILKNMRKFAGKPEDMGERYAAIAEAARMHDLPDEEKMQYLRNMITEEEKIELYDTGLEDGVEKGREQGREEGMKIGLLEGNRRIVQNMFAKGLDKAKIQDLTGLSAEEIASLQ